MKDMKDHVNLAVFLMYSQKAVDLLCCKGALTCNQLASHQILECLGKAVSSVVQPWPLLGCRVILSGLRSWYLGFLQAVISPQKESSFSPSKRMKVTWSLMSLITLSRGSHAPYYPGFPWQFCQCPHKRSAGLSDRQTLTAPPQICLKDRYGKQ